ncbi:DNA (cytosine-5-)-methyltransferase [Bacillus subtilis]|nr:DNA (cytosine-5-)-methyltransferase [Bacillus subtilis]MED3693403.1 DNA (cytosine-5-)-methyltransferase [Bacillus subtilis]
MLKLATVFSGIGAIEHALQRSNIEHEIAFACDNGGVDIFSKKISKDYDDIERHVVVLDKLIDFDIDDENAIGIDEHLKKIKGNFKELKRDLILIGREFKKMLANTELIAIKELVNIDDDNIHYLLDNVRNTIEKFKKVESAESKSIVKQLKAFIDNDASKKALKDYGLIIDSINMFYERIQTAKIHKELEKISDFKEKKAYVDKLYAGKQKSNFVYKSYKANYDIEDENFHWNISFLDGKQYKGKVDLFVGGSPCQSFSMVGKRRGLEDTRGTLFYEYARLIKEIEPKVFIYENVRGLLNHDEGNTWEVMKEVFKELNYSWEYKILNAKDYGVPQNRERLFVVGFRNDIKLKSKFEFPKPVELKLKMQDLLLDNVSAKYYLNQKGVDFVTMQKNLDKRFTQIDGEIQLCQKANQQFNWHGDFVFVEENKDIEKTIDDLEKYFLSAKVEKYVMASGTKNFYSKPEIDLEIARPLLTTMHKMHRAGVDNYVTTQGRIRKLTPRECLRLMGFCDSFKIVVSDTQMYQQAGNSIVVDVLIAILESIKNVLPELFTSQMIENEEGFLQFAF